MLRGADGFALSALGRARISGNHLNLRMSEASAEAAERLFHKARNVWESDVARAMGYLKVAAKMPINGFEASVPLLWAARFGLFEAIADTVEASEADDQSWLDYSLQVLAEADEHARFVMRDVLADIDDYVLLAAVEKQRIAEAIEAIAAQTPADEMLDLGFDEIVARGASVVAAAARYEQLRSETG